MCVCAESGSDSEEESSKDSEKTSSDSGKSSSESDSDQKMKKLKKTPRKKVKSTAAGRYSESTCLWDSKSIIFPPC